ncbi:MAG: HvfC/BufC family peptide modification chaperone [Pyrinomonadaceae bacterium]
MSENLHDLKTLEHWLQAVVTNPAAISGGLASAEARQHIDISSKQIEEVFTRSRSLKATQRLAIYSHAYLARLQECLRAEFPILLHALGEELFTLFTLEYLKNFPSRSYTLNRLGENFPRYLAESRPDASAPASERESWPDFIVDLATFERAFAEVFDGPGVEGRPILDRDRLSKIPIESLLQTPLLPVVCFRLLAFHYPVSQYFDAARRKENPELPQPANSYLAMNRRNYVVQVHELTAPQHELLTALTTGSPLGQLPTGQVDQQDCVRTALDWLGVWADKGFFSILD